MVRQSQAGVLWQRELPGTWYAPAELGRGAHQSAEDLLASLRLPTQGEIFDLDAGRWAGMPVLPSHPPFLITTYRTPRGMEADGDAPIEAGREGPRTGFMTEVMMGSAHTGTHIDALCHITSGNEWFGNGTESQDLGDFGPKRAEASSIPPFICRGVLLDIAGLRGVPALPAGDAITTEDIEAACERQGLSLHQGDAVLIRTGYMSVWGGQIERQRAHYGAGIDLSAATTLADAGAVLIGADTEDLECIPSPDGGFLPVHAALMHQQGVHIGELLYLEQLAARGVGEFLFLCLTLRVRGATGSMVRPVAIV